MGGVCCAAAGDDDPHLQSRSETTKLVGEPTAADFDMGKEQQEAEELAINAKTAAAQAAWRAERHRMRRAELFGRN